MKLWSNRLYKRNKRLRVEQGLQVIQEPQNKEKKKHIKRTSNNRLEEK